MVLAPNCASRRWLPSRSLSWFVSLSSSMFSSPKYLLWPFLKITVSNALHGSQATFSYSPLLKTVGGSEVYISRRPSSLIPGCQYFVNQISQKKFWVFYFFSIFPSVCHGSQNSHNFLECAFFPALNLGHSRFLWYSTSVNFFNMTVFLSRKCFVL